MRKRSYSKKLYVADLDGGEAFLWGGELHFVVNATAVNYEFNCIDEKGMPFGCEDKVQPVKVEKKVILEGR